MLHSRQGGRRGAGLSTRWGISLHMDCHHHTSLFPASVLPILQHLHVPICRNRGCMWKISGPTAAVPRYNSKNISIVTFSVILHQRKETEPGYHKCGKAIKLSRICYLHLQKPHEETKVKHGSRTRGSSSLSFLTTTEAIWTCMTVSTGRMVFLLAWKILNPSLFFQPCTMKLLTPGVRNDSLKLQHIPLAFTDLMQSNTCFERFLAFSIGTSVTKCCADAIPNMNFTLWTSLAHALTRIVFFSPPSSPFINT